MSYQTMTKRQPTPTGWSDTDWIKKLQDEEENPLGCLHINQGSFDAAADAYEEEYKMSKRTAMDIALDLDAASCSSFAKLEAAEALRQQHAEIERLVAINSALIEKGNSYVIENARQAEEIERLKTVPMKYRRMAFNAQLQEEIKQLTADREAAIATAVAAERDAHAAEIDSLKRERHHIYDLLARIHRDGGQYTAEHGVEKACDDAEAQVVAWLDTISGVDALIEQARIAEREACDMLQWAADQTRARSAT